MKTRPHSRLQNICLFNKCTYTYVSKTSEREREREKAASKEDRMPQGADTSQQQGTHHIGLSKYF